VLSPVEVSPFDVAVLTSLVSVFSLLSALVLACAEVPVSSSGMLNFLLYNISLNFYFVLLF
jgi:hypothetical protein